VRTYPFSAVVGSEDMALALVLTTVSPDVGGVLVRGEKGTAKSTIVRALAALLPELAVVQGCRFSCDPADPDAGCPDGPHRDPVPTIRPARLVELPVGATEDRVIGSLNLEKALGSGRTEYEPGLLAAAHRGILYVDEVNLLHDHLVDLLLDAAAMGRSSVEREGVSAAHAARMVMVGTMNPEEGELRPQLLDRFGLTVEIAAPRDPAQRAEVVRRRLGFDADPDAFTQRFAESEAALQRRIIAAQRLVPTVQLDDDSLTRIAEVCAAFEVDGMLADIVTARAAVAHAAWHGRQQVARVDIRAAARLALPHRRRRNPFDAPGLDEELLDRLLGPDDPVPPEGGPPEDGPPEDGPRAGGPPESDATEPPRGGEGSDGHRSEGPGSSDLATATTPGSRVAGADAPYRMRLLTAVGVGRGEAGRRSRAITSTGRTVRAAPDHKPGTRLHLPATVRAAAPHQRIRGRSGGRLELRSDDLRAATLEGRESNLVLLCVDASGSMAARRRMEAVKTAALSLLLDAYQRRDKVGLITFAGAAATLALPPTSSVEAAARRMTSLPTGGRTPLAEGLLCAAETLRVERVREPRRRPLLIVLTDGRATAGPGALRRAHRAADLLRDARVDTIVLDCETGRFTLGLAHDLSVRLQAQYLRMSDVQPGSIVEAVAAGRGSRNGRVA
jgi:magnesium chelatase subunit D